MAVGGQLPAEHDRQFTIAEHWLMGAIEKRLREELAELQVEINEEKSRIVDLGRGDSFGFLAACRT